MTKVTNEASELFGRVDGPIHVNSYFRLRYGKVEFVREHFRNAKGTLK